MLAQFNFISMAILALPLVARAQDRPACVQQCFHKMISTTNCDKTDVPCLCSDTSFVNSMVQCLRASCPSDISNSVIEEESTVCAAQGAPLSIQPSSSLSASGSATPTSSASATSETSNSRPTDGASSRNANGAITYNINAVASIVAFGLVFLML
ncbi:hypothetical protein PC9H_010402 [Pleurotus ostreatus]|uniref:CFEM domain-containing protein n=2 Tax=Pleurotus TaxID=5320 RepID=A0A8H7DLY4_PLEOS|nr:uncharacterized protein PC9H_010402 [Pleurotus ostreatus]KAF7422246.1 hypothetical protein PC9H_010402 [Pleurotus ostreatus]KAG9227817.1 hypothetical protein CCMSSC00406_0008639 [Pleurotus cornucopiae]